MRIPCPVLLSIAVLAVHFPLSQFEAYLPILQSIAHEINHETMHDFVYAQIIHYDDGVL